MACTRENVVHASRDAVREREGRGVGGGVDEEKEGDGNDRQSSAKIMGGEGSSESSGTEQAGGKLEKLSGRLSN